MQARGFDLVQDYRQRKSNQLFTNKKFPQLAGSDDITTATCLADWAIAHRDKPFFAMLWTMMTHFPYFTTGAEDNLGPTQNSFNTYLNALRFGDRAFGEMMNRLAAEKLLDDTLVIVIGDHGEAFGRHHQISHANMIYEENVHVPLMLINPKLFHGERYKTVGGMVDIAPTIMDLAHLAPAAQWQGRSLFAENRSNRTYFFAPWSDFWIGCRDGDTTVLYNANDNRYEVYDVVADPEQQHDHARKSAQQIEDAKQRIAAWAQYQQKLFAQFVPQK